MFMCVCVLRSKRMLCAQFKEYTRACLHAVPTRGVAHSAGAVLHV